MRRCVACRPHRPLNSNEIQQIHALEQELHVEILPGTEIMKDVDIKHFVHSAINSDRVLVPQPSDDPHDPLNWRYALNRNKRQYSTHRHSRLITFGSGLGY